jgi:cytochrome c oxidase subunit 2
MERLLFDVPVDGQLSFQDAATPVMEQLINFHNYVFIYMWLIITLVGYMLLAILYHFNSGKRLIAHKYLIHGTQIELIWTITPAIILMAIAFPSFQLLYLMDECIEPGVTVKVVGSQWYWSYSTDDYYPGKISFSSYIVHENDLKEGDFRLLEVDNELIVPVDTHVRVIATASDVIHSWAVPSLGVKIDALPGRLNQTSFIALREGRFYGQCSEICGANHAFMPICVKVVSLPDYIAYVKSAIEA